MKVKDLINILDKYKDYEVGLWDDGTFLEISYIEKYGNNTLGLCGQYKYELEYSGRDTEEIYTMEK